MIQIKLHRDSNTFHLDFSGHSGFAQKGSDPICAAVSATVFNFLIYVDMISKAEFFKKEVVPEKPRCYANFRINKGFEKFNAIYEYFVFSINLLKKNYPDFITLDIINKNHD